MSREQQHSNWARQVGRVFSVRARIGIGEGAVWLPRHEDERSFAAAFGSPNQHVCVDGPSGSGKTSLVLTHLERSKTSYVHITLVESTDWRIFVKEILRPLPLHRRKKSLEVEAQIGVENLVPAGHFRVSLSSERDDMATEDAIEQRASSYSEYDIIRDLERLGAVLIVDDFENASPELAGRIRGMAKLLTNPTSGVERAKFVVIGTDAVYARLMEGKGTLDQRVEEVSIGTLPTPGDAWRFLRLGFEKLNLRHPQNSGLPGEREKLRACIEAIGDAVDGLPKAINKLGADIALEGFDRSGVKAAGDIIRMANQTLTQRWSRLMTRPPAWLKIADEDSAALAVIHWIYFNGVGRIHNTGRLLNSLMDRYSAEETLASIQRLVESEFLVRTGLCGDVLFCADPASAHTVAVVLSKRPNLPGATQLLRLKEQLLLPM